MSDLEDSPIDASKRQPLTWLQRASVILDVVQNQPKAVKTLKDVAQTGNQIPYLTDDQIEILQALYQRWTVEQLRLAFPMPEESMEDYVARFNRLA